MLISLHKQHLKKIKFKLNVIDSEEQFVFYENNLQLKKLMFKLNIAYEFNEDIVLK